MGLFDFFIGCNHNWKIIVFPRFFGFSTRHFKFCDKCGERDNGIKIYMQHYLRNYSLPRYCFDELRLLPIPFVVETDEEIDFPIIPKQQLIDWGFLTDQEKKYWDDALKHHQMMELLNRIKVQKELGVPFIESGYYADYLSRLGR